MKNELENDKTISSGQEQAFQFILPLDEIRQQKKKIFVIFTAFFCALFLYLNVASKTYVASATLIPSNISSIESSGGMSLPSGISSLLGRGRVGGTTSVSTYDKYNYILTSRKLAIVLQRKYGIMQKVFSKEWNEQEEKWEQPQSLYYTIKSFVFTILDLPAWLPPDNDRLVTYISKHMSVIVSDETNILYVYLNHSDPIFAEYLLGIIVNEADQIAREAAQKRSIKQISYLTDRLNTIQKAVHKENIIEQLVKEEMILMSVSIDLPYAAEILDEVSVNLKPASPKPLLLLIITLLLATSISFFTVYYSYVKTDK